jgi:ribonuclease PH
MTQPPLRRDRRAPDQPRPLSLELEPLAYAEGSVLIVCGQTRVLVAASIERRLPSFRLDTGLGWVTAEYAMLPRATQTRTAREVSRGRPAGRSAEIQRLIGRSLRSIVDMAAMPELTVTVDCDVIQADGGTRTAAITGGYVALALALGRAYLQGDVPRFPLVDSLAAVSVGLCDGRPLLDLDYSEDSRAQVDLNVVATGSEKLVEVQGTAEGHPFSRAELDALLDLAFTGIRELSASQARALAPLLADVAAKRARGSDRSTPPKDEKELWGRPKRR